MLNLIVIKNKRPNVPNLGRYRCQALETSPTYIVQLEGVDEAALFHALVALLAGKGFAVLDYLVAAATKTPDLMLSHFHHACSFYLCLSLPTFQI